MLMAVNLSKTDGNGNPKTTILYFFNTPGTEIVN
ncbi:hypothetical protein SAMN05216325_11279 [Nitrosomonas marina]|uniref:Uncharacterized protein n=1 Tax=Nitrosomonas marina TaxID=917 RepID=A0A1H8FAB3_9PROT|nr:hypothetical protein SAMN05216325_11279 [Nitrosomonas marina]